MSLFLLMNAPALASGIGDRLEPFPHLTPWTVLLVYPKVGRIHCLGLQKSEFKIDKRRKKT
jgi:hypothetical protein